MVGPFCAQHAWKIPHVRHLIVRVVEICAFAQIFLLYLAVFLLYLAVFLLKRAVFLLAIHATRLAHLVVHVFRWKRPLAFTRPMVSAYIRVSDNALHRLHIPPHRLALLFEV